MLLQITLLHGLWTQKNGKFIKGVKEPKWSSKRRGVYDIQEVIEPFRAARGVRSLGRPTQGQIRSQQLGTNQSANESAYLAPLVSWSDSGGRISGQGRMFWSRWVMVHVYRQRSPYVLGLSITTIFYPVMEIPEMASCYPRRIDDRDILPLSCATP